MIWKKSHPFSGSGKTSLLIGFGIISKMAVDLVIAAHFGLGAETDAFFAAYTLPLMIEALIYPACQSGLVPVFVRQMAPEHTREKWTIFSTLFNLGLLVSASFLAAGIAKAPLIARLLAPGLLGSTYEVTLHLMRILFLGTLVVGPVGVMRAFLNAHSMFTAPAMLELIRGTAVLGFITIAYRSLGIEAVGWGYVVGGLLQFTMLAGTIVFRLGLGYRFTIKLATLKSAQVGRLFIVPLADYALGQTILIAERVIGSFMSAGSITAISYGHRLASVVTNVSFSGLEIVSLSSLAANFAEGTLARLEEARQTLVSGLRIVLIVGISISICIWTLSFRLVQLLFERGAFDHQATLLAAPILGAYALSIPFYGYWLLLRNYLLAAIQPKRVLTLSCVSAGINIILALVLSRHIGAAGIALAYVGGVALVFPLGFLMLDSTVRSFWRAFLRLVGTVAAASIVLGYILNGVSNQVAYLLSLMHGLSGSLVNLLSLFAAGVCAVALLPGILAALQVEEAKSFLRFVSRLRASRVLKMRTPSSQI